MSEPAFDDTSPIYFRVSPAVWRQRWTEPMRYLALYFLTCQHRTLEGLFVLPLQYISADLKWSAEQLAEPFGKLIDDGFLDYENEDEVCLITKALYYQAPANPNMVKAAVRRIAAVPETRLDELFIRSAIDYAEPLAKRLQEWLPQRFAKPQLFSALLNSAHSAGGREASPGAPPARAVKDGTMLLCPVCETQVTTDEHGEHCPRCDWRAA